MSNNERKESAQGERNEPLHHHHQAPVHHHQQHLGTQQGKYPFKKINFKTKHFFVMK